MLECGTNPSEWVVLDIGSHSLRLGFSGAPQPSLVVPSRAPPKKDRGAPKEGDGQETPRGEETAAEASPLIDRGAVASWGPFMSLCSSSLSSLLETEGGTEGRGFLVAAQPLETNETKEKLLEFLFETHRASAVAIMPRAPLGLFASGHSRGIVVEMGHGLTSTVPVFEGYEISYATYRMLIAGREVSEALRMQLANKCQVPVASLSQDLIEAAKEKLLFVSPNAQPQTTAVPQQGPPEETLDNRALELPDGTVVELDAATRSFPPEVYFGSGVEAAMPSSVSPFVSFLVQRPPVASLPSLIASSLDALGEQHREVLATNIVFCKGSSLLRGLQQRVHAALQEEIAHGGGERGHQPPSSPVSLLFDSQRMHATWIGGSLLASLGTFPSLAISRQSYVEGRGDRKALIEQQVGTT